MNFLRLENVFDVTDFNNELGCCSEILLLGYILSFALLSSRPTILLVLQSDKQLHLWWLNYENKDILQTYYNIIIKSSIAE